MLKKNFIFVNTKNFVLGYTFINVLRNALAKKSILLSNTKMQVSGSVFLLNLTVFFRYKKLKKYEKKTKKLKKNIFLNLLAAQLNQNNTQFILTKIQNLNKQVNLKLAVDFLKLFKRFKNILFSRRFDLFADFINLSALLSKALLSCEAYVFLLKQIFSIILKKKHVQYFLFINLLLKKLTDNTEIQGIKFSIAGRLKGKPRTNVLKILSGKIFCQSVSRNVSFSKIHAYTRYGVFGLKL